VFINVFLGEKTHVPGKAKSSRNPLEVDRQAAGESDWSVESSESIFALERAGWIKSGGSLSTDFIHELNNLLTVILGHTEFLLMHKESPEIFCLRLEEIRNAAARGVWLTHLAIASLSVK
jgi:signal transduction histidine kinase